jgi:hypothetical protein
VGEVRVHPLEGDAEARLTAQPVRGFDLGAGRGKSIEATVKGGVVGVVVDARGRPIQIAEEEGERVRQITEWNRAMDLYPK